MIQLTAEDASGAPNHMLRAKGAQLALKYQHGLDSALPEEAEQALLPGMFLVFPVPEDETPEPETLTRTPLPRSRRLSGSRALESISATLYVARSFDPRRARALPPGARNSRERDSKEGRPPACRTALRGRFRPPCKGLRD